MPLLLNPSVGERKFKTTVNNHKTNVLEHDKQGETRAQPCLQKQTATWQMQNVTAFVWITASF